MVKLLAKVPQTFFIAPVSVWTRHQAGADENGL